MSNTNQTSTEAKSANKETMVGGTRETAAAAELQKKSYEESMSQINNMIDSVAKKPNPGKAQTSTLEDMNIEYSLSPAENRQDPRDCALVGLSMAHKSDGNTYKDEVLKLQREHLSQMRNSVVSIKAGNFDEGVNNAKKATAAYHEGVMRISNRIKIRQMLPEGLYGVDTGSVVLIDKNKVHKSQEINEDEWTRFENKVKQLDVDMRGELEKHLKNDINIQKQFRNACEKLLIEFDTWTNQNCASIAKKYANVLMTAVQRTGGNYSGGRNEKLAKDPRGEVEDKINDALAERNDAAEKWKKLMELVNAAEGYTNIEKKEITYKRVTEEILKIANNNSKLMYQMMANDGATLKKRLKQVTKTDDMCGLVKNLEVQINKVAPLKITKEGQKWDAVTLINTKMEELAQLNDEGAAFKECKAAIELVILINSLSDKRLTQEERDYIVFIEIGNLVNNNNDYGFNKLTIIADDIGQGKKINEALKTIEDKYCPKPGALLNEKQQLMWDVVSASQKTCMHLNESNCLGEQDVTVMGVTGPSGMCRQSECVLRNFNKSMYEKIYKDRKTAVNMWSRGGIVHKTERSKTVKEALGGKFSLQPTQAVGMKGAAVQ